MLSGAIAATLPRGSRRGKGGPISRSPRPLPGPGVVGLPSRGRIPPGLAVSEQAVEQRLRAPSHELARGPSERLARERLACDLLDATLTVPTRACPTALLDDPPEHRVAPTPRSSATTWQRCGVKTPSALTVAKVPGVNSRFPLANFRGRQADRTAGAAEASFLPFTRA